MDIESRFHDRGGSQGEVPGNPGGLHKPSEVENTLRRIRSTLRKQKVRREGGDKRLTALRKSQDKARQQLYKAEQGLRDVLALLQETRLSLTGSLR